MESVALNLTWGGPRRSHAIDKRGVQMCGQQGSLSPSVELLLCVSTGLF